MNAYESSIGDGISRKWLTNLVTEDYWFLYKNRDWEHGKRNDREESRRWTYFDDNLTIPLPKISYPKKSQLARPDDSSIQHFMQKWAKMLYRRDHSLLIRPTHPVFSQEDPQEEVEGLCTDLDWNDELIFLCRSQVQGKSVRCRAFYIHGVWSYEQGEAQTCPKEQEGPTERKFSRIIAWGHRRGDYLCHVKGEYRRRSKTGGLFTFGDYYFHSTRR